jgi:hypothetical protein
VRLQLWVNEGGVDFGGDAVGDGLEEEGDGSAFDVWFGLVVGKYLLSFELYSLPMIRATIRIVKSEPSV